MGFDHYVIFVKELQFENQNWKMPFYDGIGVIAEKHAVVLDIGSAFTKVGYAGESSPRFGFCVLNFLSILSDFLSREKLTQK